MYAPLSILMLLFMAQIREIRSFISAGHTAIPTSRLTKVASVFAKLDSPVHPTERNTIQATKQEPFFSGKTLIEHGAMGTKKVMVWNEATSSFKYHSESKFSLRRALHGHFFPSGELTPDYYKYAMWRATQRLVSATNSVFGTQALLMALGFNKKRIGVAAATAWVLKDCLGKVSRIFWASVNGRKFDGDAKKWRFRASLLFVLGSALEIVTYVFPAFFLVTAALANAMKQMAMVTSSATRNAIYKSFSRNSDNIGDITAKGEAQIAVIDLLGLLIGIKISKLTNLSKVKIVSVFVLLSMVDLYCVYNEIRSVVFHVLNFERSGCVLQKAFDLLEQTQRAVLSSSPAPISATQPVALASNKPVNTQTSAAANNTGEQESDEEVYVDIENDSDIVLEPYESMYSTTPLLASVPTTAAHDSSGTADASQSSSLEGQLSPAYVAKHEQLLLPSMYGEKMIKTWSTLSQNDANSLQEYVQYAVDQKENVVVILSARLVYSWVDAYLVKIGARKGDLRIVGGYPVVLTTELLVHNNATPTDLFRALVQVNRIMYDMNREATNTHSVNMKQVTTGLKSIPRKSLYSARARSRTSQRNLFRDGVQRIGQVYHNIIHGDHSSALLDTVNSAGACASVGTGTGGSASSGLVSTMAELDADQVLLEQIGLGQQALLTRVQRTHEYERSYLYNITSILSEAGWVADRFMFGAINRRVEW